MSGYSSSCPSSLHLVRSAPARAAVVPSTEAPGPEGAKQTAGGIASPRGALRPGRSGGRRPVVRGPLTAGVVLRLRVVVRHPDQPAVPQGAGQEAGGGVFQ